MKTLKELTYIDLRYILRLHFKCKVLDIKYFTQVELNPGFPRTILKETDFAVVIQAELEE